MFTPIETSIGAVLLHQATSILLFQNGTVLGVSGILRRFTSSPTKENMSFMAGMALSYLPLRALVPELLTHYPPVPTTIQAALMTLGIGALVGLGTKLSNGCTSGHMLCGLSRLSGRSALAVATFFPAAVVTHHLVHPTLATDACPPGSTCYIPTYPSSETTNTLILLAIATIFAAQTIPAYIAKIAASETKTDNNKIARQATQFCVGMEFGLGLHISQMSSPGKVLSFLSLPNWNAWDPSLALVMLFGVLPNLIDIQLRGFDKAPLFRTKFELPSKTLKDTDWKFVLGAAMFGIGWGLTGTCPGPAILRAAAQPTWGLLWMSGFWLGGLFG